MREVVGVADVTQLHPSVTPDVTPAAELRRQVPASSPLPRVNHHVGCEEAHELRVGGGHTRPTHVGAFRSGLVDELLEHLVEHDADQLPHTAPPPSANPTHQPIERALLSVTCPTSMLILSKSLCEATTVRYTITRKLHQARRSALSTAADPVPSTAANAHGGQREERQQGAQRIRRVVHDPRELELLHALGRLHRVAQWATARTSRTSSRWSPVRGLAGWDIAGVGADERRIYCVTGSRQSGGFGFRAEPSDSGHQQRGARRSAAAAQWRRGRWEAWVDGQ
ncbi:unnamed protein product [Phytophthora fragariaefolia]|uniref:Unnamed protein product n=1 Tax=Phytophthora fragariaefolia TaxID=1490495 RepID=A0A9W7DBS3_9STRA|nr:unnamed protein product [Phytophthora fragariaefolia]